MELNTQLKEFARLGGNLKFAAAHGGTTTLEPSEREKVQWKTLQRTYGEGMSPDEFELPDDHEQPEPLVFQVLFTAETPGVYDAQWVAPPGALLDVGDVVVRTYSVADGSRTNQKVNFKCNVLECLAERNQKLVPGDPVVKVSIPSLALDRSQLLSDFSQVQMNLAQAVNAMIKGYFGAIGEGGQVTDGVTPIRTRLYPERGYEDLCQQIVDSLVDTDISDGDTVVVSEKVIAISQGRIFPAGGSVR